MYEDHNSDDDAPHESTPKPASALSPAKRSADEVLNPNQSAAISEPEELSEHDEENDPIVHSFSAAGDNILSRFQSFPSTSPERKRKPLMSSFNSPGLHSASRTATMASRRRASKNDDEYQDESPSKRQKKVVKGAPPLYKATVIETADNGSVRVSSSTADLDEGLLARMRKCLERANHPGTPEAETKAALHIASKLMKMYEVTQAEVLAHETPEAQRNYAGQSTVSIARRDGDETKKVLHNTYIDPLCWAMCDLLRLSARLLQPFKLTRVTATLARLPCIGALLPRTGLSWSSAVC